MAWNDAVVTNAGVALLRQVLSGEMLTLDGAAGGTGTVSSASLMAQTALKDKKQTFSIVGMTDVENGKKINIQVTNLDLETGYTLNQVGIWAHIGTGESVLYAILQDPTGITIPSKAEMQDFAMNLYAVVDFSNNATVNLTVDATALVTRADLNEALKGKMSSIKTLTAEDGVEDPDLFAFHDTSVGENRKTTWANIKSKLKSKLKEFFLAKTGDGKDVTVTFAEATTRTNIGTGEKLSTVFGKIKKWFSDLTDLAFGKCGSAANQALYTTAGGVVTADKLPVEAGGTNARTAERARENLGAEAANDNLVEYVNSALKTLGGMSVSGGAQIETGSYTGTGTYGSDNPNRLTFGFEPYFIAFFTESSNLRKASSNKTWDNGKQLAGLVTMLTTSYKAGAFPYSHYDSGRDYYSHSKMSEDRKTLYWYSSDSAGYQYNSNDTVYYYVAIG